MIFRNAFAGENFVRYTGEVRRIADQQLFAWDASEKGVDIHLQADPTKAELLHKNYETNKRGFQDSQKESILERVGSLVSSDGGDGGDGSACLLHEQLLYTA